MSSRFCKRSLLHESLDYSLIDKIPGRQTDRRTLLGELNWIFTAVTDTIAWNVLPHGILLRYTMQFVIMQLLISCMFHFGEPYSQWSVLHCRSFSEIVQTRFVSCQPLQEFFTC